MFVNGYGLEIKGIYTYEYLVLINMKVVDDDKMEGCLRDLGPQCKSLKRSTLTRETIPDFVDLVSMIYMEERNLSEETNRRKWDVDNHALCSNIEEIEALYI